MFFDKYLLCKVQERALRSRPLDLDQVDARLRKLSSVDNNDDTTPLRDRPTRTRITRSPSPVCVQEARKKGRETDIYNDLVKDGGRPLYPIHLLDDIFENPEEHAELTRPWRLGWKVDFPWKSADPWDEPRTIFQRQRERWEDFRKWQNDNRGIEEDAGYPAFVEKTKFRQRRFAREATARLLAHLEADPSYLEKLWERDQDMREEQRYRCRDSQGGKGFVGYIETAKRRLARHGLTRPFQFQEDPKQQDKLTEWIKYLNYECWWLEWYTRALERLRSLHDEPLQALVDAGVAKHHATIESIWSTKYWTARNAERERVAEAHRRAMARAKHAYTSTQLAPDRLSIPAAERNRRVLGAIRELKAAQAARDSEMEKNLLFLTFRQNAVRFMHAKSDSPRHGILVQWILNQVPLIEAELAQSEATAKTQLEETKGGTKRRLDPGDDDDVEVRALKQQRL
ncbi:hypothetical protein F5B17DRAFT_399991 [Nemania serpens]|nr:hypothetical protein F5B17DRAFT_399991 [Nemania serpens]